MINNPKNEHLFVGVMALMLLGVLVTILQCSVPTLDTPTQIVTDTPVQAEQAQEVEPQVCGQLTVSSLIPELPQSVQAEYQASGMTWAEFLEHVKQRESGGDPYAVGGGRYMGLFQINQEWINWFYGYDAFSANASAMTEEEFVAWQYQMAEAYADTHHGGTDQAVANGSMNW